MEIKSLIIDNKEVQFVNESYSTRNGFKHVTKMFVGNCCVGENTCHYLNRTWEAYRYQTVMRGCVNNLIEIRIENLKLDFKFKNGYSKMTAKRNEEFNESIKDDETLIFYRKLLSKI